MYLCCKVLSLRHLQKVLLKRFKSKSVLMKCRKESYFPPKYLILYVKTAAPFF